jgi:hypothetical protein
MPDIGGYRSLAGNVAMDFMSFAPAIDQEQAKKSAAVNRGQGMWVEHLHLA